MKKEKTTKLETLISSNIKSIFAIIFILLFTLTGCNRATTLPIEIPEDMKKDETTEIVTDVSTNELITVDNCDTRGHRLPNVKVDVGYEERDYFGYTNTYGQLVLVTANEVILQDDANENVNADGRYCNDEAKVSGVESKTLDEGHAIADSLGGTSNAYNITPQNSNLNRKGQQYKMEDTIRQSITKGNKITNFKYEIKYPDTTTSTPSEYIITFDENNSNMTYSFKNE